jgi:hypothetical protein
MPNDCWNKITIKGETDQIKEILTTDFKSVPERCFQIFMVGKGALIFRIWSAWNPDKELMNRLLEKYENLWIKNVWQEEGGMCGIIVGKKGELQEIVWEEGCEEEWNDRLEEVEMPDPALSCEDE